MPIPPPPDEAPPRALSRPPERRFARRFARRFPHAAGQLYYLALAAINALHGLLPFALRPLLYRACGYAVEPGAAVQGGVRFFHVGRLRIGAGSRVNRGVYLDNRAGLTIGRHVSIAHDCRLYTLGHDIRDPGFAPRGRPVVVEDHAVLFAGAMLMPGVTVGRGAVVMAGAVVTHDVPPGRVVGGNPARDLGERGLDPAYRLDGRYWFAH
ncbi:acyltransferase [Piscinibacter sakaiensis]|uniref:Putative acetyltransferase n=1 Tax=Piscinibacter sakaiensis TaxID=1547922 RepID=A0A0K8NU06_PISS1|nr:acyltransferase [Piscinibacter sakaiensis]GAP33848.1 putative acetyltransferase [Piscinibacter sakaiensis]